MSGGAPLAAAAAAVLLSLQEAIFSRRLRQSCVRMGCGVVGERANALLSGKREFGIQSIPGKFSCCVQWLTGISFIYFCSAMHTKEKALAAAAKLSLVPKCVFCF